MLNFPTDVPQSLVPSNNAKAKVKLPRVNFPAVLENIFERHGRNVSKYPYMFIFCSLLLSVLSAGGLYFFKWETNLIRMWNHEDSANAKNFQWLWETNPPEIRPHVLIFTSEENILSPESILQMHIVRKNLFGARTPRNRTWFDLCYKIPHVPQSYASVLDDFRNNEKKNSSFSDDFFSDDFLEDKVYDPSVYMYPYPYCETLEDFEKVCFENSILELFAKDGKLTDEMITNLTQEDILRIVNDKEQRSGMFTIKKDFRKMLAKVTYNEQGLIVGAKAVRHVLFGKMNTTQAKIEREIKISSIIGDQMDFLLVDQATNDIEDDLMRIVHDKSNYPPGFNSEFFTHKGFQDEVNDSIVGNIPRIIGGFVIMFSYVAVMLGKFNWIENKVVLSGLGLVSIGMAMLVTNGLCSLFGFAFTPLHNLAPFLFLGLGVDDMFVIIQAWDRQVAGSVQKELLLGKTLKCAGVAITVTSITDFMAFGVGGSTEMPALKSFCFYCGIGIFVIYLYQITWFSAWLEIDRKRVEANRNGLFPCIKHTRRDRDTSEEKEPTLSERCFKLYSRLLLQLPSKICVFVITAIVFGFSLWGNILLKQEFEPWWFLPKESHSLRYKLLADQVFPHLGEDVFVVFGDINLRDNLERLDWYSSQLKNETELITAPQSWFYDFKQYHLENFAEDNEIGEKSIWTMSQKDFNQRMTQFLFSPIGAKHRAFFVFDGDLKCGKPAPNVTMSMMQYSHKLYSDPPERILAMNKAKQILKEALFPGRVFTFSPGYSLWEIDEIIRSELYRNLGLALSCIFLTTFFLLANINASLQVFSCVLLTLVNVAGFLHFWDLTIDPGSCTMLIICIGLCVDSAAHIAHAFLKTADGSRDERAASALITIGPAVLNGGISTFLAVVLLATSTMRLFITFFKIFFLVIMFALYNGLVLLPVMLSLFGPKDGSTDDGPDTPEVPEPEVPEMTRLTKQKPEEDESIE